MKSVEKILISLMIGFFTSSAIAESDKKDVLTRAKVEYSVNGEYWTTINKQHSLNNFKDGGVASDSFCAIDAIENGLSSSLVLPFCYLVQTKLTNGPSRIEENKGYGQCMWIIENGKIGDSVEGKCFGANWRVTLVNGSFKN